MIKFDKYFFFNTESWLKTCFKFLMLITCSVLSCKLATSFSIFQLSLFQLKMVNDCEIYVNFLGTEYQPQKKKKKKNFFIITFLKLSSNSESSLTNLKLLTSNFCDIAESCKLFTSQYLGYENLHLPQFFMYLLLAFTYQWIAWKIYRGRNMMDIMFLPL